MKSLKLSIVILAAFQWKAIKKAKQIMKINHFVCAVCVGILGCSKPADFYAPAYSNYDPGLIQQVDVDKNVFTDFYPGDYETIHYSDSLHPVQGSALAVSGNSIYLIDMHQNLLIKYGLASKKREIFSFKGRGPGEYESLALASLFYKDDFIFVVDIQNRKLIKYNLDLNFINEYSLEGIIFSKPIQMDIFENALYHLIDTQEEHLIGRFSLEQESAGPEYFHERTIPLGKQSSLYNYRAVSINETGEIAVVPGIMPLVFIYNQELELREILRIKGQHLDAIGTSPDNSIPKGLASRPTEDALLLNPPPVAIAARGARHDALHIAASIYLGDYLLFYFSNQYSNERYLIALKREKNTWKHTGSYRFYREEGQRFSVNYMSYDANWIYLGNLFQDYIVRVERSRILKE